MAKWSGMIGYRTVVETEPGVWEPQNPTEVRHYGDVINNRQNNQQTTDTTNTDIKLSVRLSIIANPFATENFVNMEYATINNTRWRIESVELQHPRLILQIGGLYNGQ